MNPDSLYEDYDNETEFDGEMCNLGGNHDKEVVIQTYMYSFICALGLLGNILVLVTYAFYKKAKTMTDIYLVNVALADLLFVIALPLIIYNERFNWSMGTFACKVLRGTYSINLYSSVLLLACISGDRYIVIVRARRSIGIRFKAQMYSRLLCSVVWLLAILLSVPTFMYYELYQENNLYDLEINATFGQEIFQEVGCSMYFDTTETAELMKILVPSMQVTVGFFLPMLVMGFCYCSILVTLLSAKSYRKHRAVRMVLAVVLVFILCQLPYNIALLLHTTKLFNQRDCQTEQNILLTVSVTRSLAYLHCCLNPILYAFIGAKFRSHFYQIMQDLWCLGKKYFSSGRSSQQTSELYFPVHKPNNENPSSFSI